MDEAAGCGHEAPTQGPEHDQYQDNCPKHNIPPYQSCLYIHKIDHCATFVAAGLEGPGTRVAALKKKVNSNKSVMMTNAAMDINAQLTPRYALAVSSRTITSSP